MKTKQRLRIWLAARSRLALAALVLLGVGGGWMLAGMWSDWEQRRYPVQSQAGAVMVSADRLPLP